jgi:serine/threonine protein kinase
MVAQGSFGKIYQTKHLNKNFAIKFISSKKNNLILNLNKIYEEYFISLVASLLKIGPKVQKLFCYDIVVTKSKAMFAM